MPLDELGRARGQVDREVGVFADDNVGAAHQDHRVQGWFGCAEVVGSSDREPRRGDVVAAVLGDPAAHFGDSAGGTANVVTQRGRGYWYELFDGDQVAINEVAGVGGAEDMFGLDMGGPLRREHVDDVGADGHLQ